GHAPERDREDSEGDLRHDPERAFAADKESGEAEDAAGERVRDRRKVVAAGVLPDGTAARQDRLTMDFDRSAKASQGRHLLRGLFPLRTVDAEVASHKHGPVDE